MFWSRLSDHIGRKPILFLGTFALATSMISFGLSSVFWALVVRYDGISHLISFYGRLTL
jgi:MFS family permease